MEDTETTEKKIKAKQISLIGQIVAGLWLIFWTGYKFIKSGGNEIAVEDIIFSSFAIAGCFSPVYISIVVDKLKGLKK